MGIGIATKTFHHPEGSIVWTHFHLFSRHKLCDQLKKNAIYKIVLDIGFAHKITKYVCRFNVFLCYDFVKFFFFRIVCARCFQLRQIFNFQFSISNVQCEICLKLCFLFASQIRFSFRYTDEKTWFPMSTFGDTVFIAQACLSQRQCSKPILFVWFEKKKRNERRKKIDRFAINKVLFVFA